MNTENSGELTPQEKTAFKKLSQEKMPPNRVEKEIVIILYKKGLLETKKMFPFWQNHSPVFQGAVILIAVCLLFSMGFSAGVLYMNNQVPGQPKSQFALFIINDEVAFKNEMALASEYAQWMKNIVASGRSASGKQLFDGGKILYSLGGEIKASDVSTDDRYGQIGGFFLIDAASYDEAVKIASTCPHLKYQGSIEVRQIHKH